MEAARPRADEVSRLVHVSLDGLVKIPDSHEVVGLKGRRFYSINSVKAFTIWWLYVTLTALRSDSSSNSTVHLFNHSVHY